MIPEKIDRYQIKAELGRGGMATVYHAYDPRFERDVAIKILPREFLHDPQFRARFEREAKAIASLEHSAIVPVYDFGEDQGQPFIVMRLMSGGTLADRLQKGPLSLDDSIQILSRLAPALDAAHRQGIIHRDLKPGNILFDQYDNAFLTDFGIARLSSSSTALTGTGLVGTPVYMSPEQVQGDQEIDGRSDIYALGIILFQMLTGKPPFQADTPAKQMMAHLLEPVPTIRVSRPDLSESCDLVLQNALAKDRNDRFATAQDLTNALSQVSDGIPLQLRISTPRGPDATLLAAPRTDVPLPAHLSSATVVSQGNLQSQTIPVWIYMVAGVALIAVLGAGLFGGLALFSREQPTATPNTSASGTNEPLAAILVLKDTATPEPSPTFTSTPTVTPTETAIPMPTATEEPTREPTSTPTLEPQLPVIGGADLIAFLNSNDLIIVNVDGSDLRQLTSDGAEKKNLQWSPDGSAINFITGKCARSIDIESGAIDDLVCIQAVEFFEAFEISPDGSRVAVSIDRQLFVVPFNKDSLAQVRFRTDLQALGECEYLAPYNRGETPLAVKFVRWSTDGQKLAMTILGADTGIRVDLISIIDISRCVEKMDRLDEFPAQRFTVSNYDTTPIIQNFDWNGDFLFIFSNFVRNDGFGDFYIYNLDLHRAVVQVRPVENTCCYRDPAWSPDGSHVIFAFQDLRLGSASRTKLYYIPFGTIGTGLSYQPLPLPEEFFANPKEKPQPVLRPAIQAQP